MKGLVSTVLEGGSSWTGHGMEEGINAVRVNGLSSVSKKTRGTMQPAVKVEAGGETPVASAGAELTKFARAMRETKTVLVRILTNAVVRCGFNLLFDDLR